MITNDVREPAVAGTFYEREPKKLKSEIIKFFEEVKPPEINGTVIGIASPHAGYFYSGKTAAYGYKLLQGLSYETVIVISPSHYEYFDGVSIYNGRAYMTPFGLIEIDNELRDALAENKKIISVSGKGHGREHALEVQLPFLQSVLKDFKLLPIVIGNQSEEVCRTLSEILAEEIAGKSVLLVASSDLSHYHSHDIADSLDSKIHRHIENYDYESIMEDMENEKVEACGGGPIVTVMQTAKLLGADKSKILYRCDSSEASGDFRQVVGYLSAVFYKEN
ncbi:MAG: AmmeMemoRadiSam system protein B [Bacteroidetes bacterium]|nr:AmmeMemoRadiSam system protein B [Bacteroidota bacterium]MBU2585050.1 AmmeMemoRadiSam system protein B [Bacteroidota bacterium]